MTDPSGWPLMNDWRAEPTSVAPVASIDVGTLTVRVVTGAANGRAPGGTAVGVGDSAPRTMKPSTVILGCLAVPRTTIFRVWLADPGSVRLYRMFWARNDVACRSTVVLKTPSM